LAERYGLIGDGEGVVSGLQHPSAGPWPATESGAGNARKWVIFVAEPTLKTYMKKLSYIALGLFLLTGLVSQQADAQSIVGKWKRTGLVMVNAGGVKQDVDKMMRQAMPCMKNIVYTFMPNGTLITDATTCAATQRKMIESMNAKSRWSMSGNKITASVTDKSVPPSVHTVSFAGNTMTWQFNFADNPRMPNPTKAKSMTTVYQRL
jgi:hypothetical protein